MYIHTKTNYNTKEGRTVQIGRQVNDLEQKIPLTYYMIFFVILPLSYVSKFGRGFFFHIWNMKTVKVIGENVSSLHELVNSAIDDAYPFHSMMEYAILIVCIIHGKKKKNQSQNLCTTSSRST